MNELLKKLAEERNWSLEDQLELCLDYIKNQKSDNVFEEFINEAASTEQDIDECLKDGGPDDSNIPS